MLCRIPLFADEDCTILYSHQVEMKVGPVELEVSVSGFLFWLNLPHRRVLAWENGHWPHLFTSRRYEG